jgi:hypothetical protein
MEDKSKVILYHVFVCIVCVPKTYTKEQIEEFANRANPTGIQSKWYIPEKYRNRVWTVAWSKGHSEGFYSVYNQLIELIEIF